MRREILSHRGVFTLEAEKFGGNATAASKRLQLRQRARNKLAIFDNRRGSGCNNGEQSIIVDERKYGIFVQRRFGFGTQIFKRYECAAVAAFPLADCRKGVAITGQVCGANTGAFGNENRARWREVRFIELLRSAKAA